MVQRSNSETRLRQHGQKCKIARVKFRMHKADMHKATAFQWTSGRAHISVTSQHDHNNTYDYMVQQSSRSTSQSAESNSIRLCASTSVTQPKTANKKGQPSR